jgi:hypothetical protein
MSRRMHYIKVSLERAVFLRGLLYEPPDGSDVCTHGEGRTTAALGLEKALRGNEQPLGALEDFLRGD